MWAQSLPVAMAAKKPWSPFHGGRRAVSVVSQKPYIPYVSNLQLSLKLPKPNSTTQPQLSASSSIAPPFVQIVKARRVRPSAELGLVSLLFVLSMAFAALFSVAIICVPSIKAFRRLADAVDKLSNVVSQEVPGTLSSLKLSGLEINDLTQQLASLRQSISTTRRGKNAN